MVPEIQFGVLHSSVPHVVTLTCLDHFVKLNRNVDEKVRSHVYQYFNVHTKSLIMLPKIPITQLPEVITANGVQMIDCFACDTQLDYARQLGIIADKMRIIVRIHNIGAVIQPVY